MQSNPLKSNRMWSSVVLRKTDPYLDSTGRGWRSATCVKEFFKKNGSSLCSILGPCSHYRDSHVPVSRRSYVCRCVHTEYRAWSRVAVVEMTRYMTRYSDTKKKQTWQAPDRHVTVLIAWIGPYCGSRRRSAGGGVLMNCNAADPVPWPFAYTNYVTNTKSQINLTHGCAFIVGNVAVRLCDREMSEMEGETV